MTDSPLGFPLTKRELIAAIALHGLLTNPEVSGPIPGFACEAINLADALIEKLNEAAPHE